MVTSLTKKNIQELDKTHTKIIQNTKFVYILYIKIAQIKISYNNECTKNIQSANWKELETLNVCFLYIQTMYKLHKTYTTR